LSAARPGRWLAAGMRTLKALRNPKGGWRTFRFWYAVLALGEIDLPGAVREMRYAAPACERLLKRSATGEMYDRRRRLLAERVLARC